MELIDKGLLIKEIKERIQKINDMPIPNSFVLGVRGGYEDILSLLDTFTVIDMCIHNPVWKVGDVLAVYPNQADIKEILGPVIEVNFDEEMKDWFYTFKDPADNPYRIPEKELLDGYAHISENNIQ